MNSGVIFTLLFTLAAAARDVFFGGVFQYYRYFDVVLVTFGLAAALFLTLVAVRAPEQLGRLRRAWRECLIANIGTAAAWSSFFFALKMLEPAIVNTIHAGMGTVTLMAMGALGLRISVSVQVRSVERWIQAGVFVTLLALRFLLGIAVCGAAVAAGIGVERPLVDVGAIATVGGAGLLLIVLPLYLFQLGLARTSAVSVWVIQALGPCLAFAGQLVDGRIRASPWTMALVVVYSALVIAGALIRRYERA